MIVDVIISKQILTRKEKGKNDLLMLKTLNDHVVFLQDKTQFENIKAPSKVYLKSSRYQDKEGKWRTSYNIVDKEALALLLE